MKIQLMSDVHLEFAPMTIPETDADILLLAGDIVPLARLDSTKTDANSRSVQRRTDHFAYQLTAYKEVYYILGNHEYYHGVWEDVVQEARDYWAEHCKNVTVLNDETVLLRDGLRLWGGTLWTDFAGGNPVFMEAVREGMNDYRMIKTIRDPHIPYARRYSSILPGDTQEAHENSRYSLKEEIERYPNDTWIVMTHHLPSFQSVPERFKGDMLNYGFASDMDKFIMDHPQIHTWVHGHTHDNCDYKIGETRILCNPRGYAHPGDPNHPQNKSFNPSLVFEI